MIPRVAWAAAAFALVCASGCADYEKVAELQERNLALIDAIESRLATPPDVNEKLARQNATGPDAAKERAAHRDEEAKWLQTRLDQDRTWPLTVATAKAAIADAEYAAALNRAGLTPQERAKIELDYGDARARIQEQLYQDLDDEVVRAKRTHDLYVKLLEALRALRDNGKDVDEYLRMGFFSRLFTDVKGLDQAKLKNIGDDLKRIGDGLKPYVDPYIKQITTPALDLIKGKG